MIHYRIMEKLSQITSGDVVRIKPDYEDEDERGKHYTVKTIEGPTAEILWGNRMVKYRKKVPVIILQKLEE